MNRISSTNRLVRVYLVCLAVLLVAGAATAQQRGSRRDGAAGGGKAAQMMERMTERLSLTEKQQEEIQKIYKTRAEGVKELMAKARKSGSDREAMRKKMSKYRKETDAQIQAILDEKQLAEFKKISQERDERMSKSRDGSGDRPRRRDRPGAEKTEKTEKAEKTE